MRARGVQLSAIISVSVLLLCIVGSFTFFNPRLTDSQIKEKVDFIKKNLKLRQTQQEVATILGKDYFIANDNGDIENGSDSFWKYRFYMEKGYTSQLEDHQIDEQGLRSRKVGVELFIGWKEERVYFYSISYVQGKENDLTFYLVNPDGSTSEETTRNQQAPVE